MAYIHIKLDKIVAGDQKRLFKTSQQIYDKENILKSIFSEDVQANTSIEPSKNLIYNQLFYGKYSKKLEAANIQESYNSQLLQFNQVSPEYITKKNKVNAKQYLTTNKYYGKVFEANAVRDTDQNQNISYFKSIVDIPIDVASVENVAYLLSPLGIKKNVQIYAPEFNINLKNYAISADFKENYGELFKYILSKEVHCPEKEGIPIYDLNFTDIQTITFQTKEKLINWLKKYTFDTTVDKISRQPLSSIITCNINNKFNDDYDSINLTKLFELLEQQEHNMFFTQHVKKELIKDLIDNLNQDSFNCKMSAIGTVSKLAQQTKHMFVNNQSLLNTISSNRKQAIQYLTKQQKDFYTENSIPNNSIYLLQLLNPIQFNDDVKNKPSAFFNFVNLKNMQTPLQDFQISIPQIKEEEFSIYGNKKEYDSAIFEEKDLEYKVYNKDTVKLYDIDKTQSYQFNSDTHTDRIIFDSNIAHSIPNMYVTSSILEQSIKYDQQCRADASISSLYTFMDANTIRSKSKNYLIPFYQRHIIDNKQYEIGQLNGLRSYTRTGILDDQQNIWLTYKYVTSKSNDLNASYNSIYEMPFKSYKINRYFQHMQYNQIGIAYEGLNDIRISKQQNGLCPYKFMNKMNPGCSGMICKALLQSEYKKLYMDQLLSDTAILANQNIENICDGYCGFPINKKYLQIDTPTGLYWSNTTYKNKSNNNIDILNSFSYTNDNWLEIIPLTNMSGTLVAQTDLLVSDDIEIYFSNKTLEQLQEYISNNGPFYDSIFGGFGHEGKQDYYDYLLRNNPNVKSENIIHHKHISSYFSTVQIYTQKYLSYTNNTYLSALFDKPLYFFIDSTYLNNLAEKQQYQKYFNKRLLQYFLLDENIALKPLIDIKYSYLIYGKQYIKNIDQTLIDSNATYYNLYTDILYKFIKQLVIDPQKNLKLKDMPIADQIVDTKLLYNNFVIAQNTPFNGPHKIYKDTKLTGLIITTSSNNTTKIGGKSNIIPKGHRCYIRVVNWWSDDIYCTGKIKIDYGVENIKTSTYNKILNTINCYDHVQLIDGFFKSAQSDYKKSNIYSLRVRNSGLNPINDKSITDFHQYLLLRNYAYLKKQYKQYYDFIDINQFKLLEQQNFTIFNNVNQLIMTKLCQANKDANISTVNDYLIYHSLDLSDNVFSKDKYRKSKCYEYIKGQGGIYKLNKEKAEKAINMRKEMRQLFQQAIRNSIHKYMPVHTDLWKIIYTEK